MRKTVLILVLLCGASKAMCQSGNGSVIDLAALPQVDSISGKCRFFVDSTGGASVAKIDSINWQPMAALDVGRYIPNAWISKPVFLRFSLANLSGTARKVFFIAGTYVKSMQLWLADSARRFATLKDESQTDGYQPIRLPAFAQREVVVRLRFTKRNFNYLTPVLVREDYLDSYKKLKYLKNDAQPAVGYLLSGVLLMMIFFSAATYVQGKKKDFLYNCCYSICMFGLVFLNTFLERRSGLLSSIFNEYLDFMLLAGGTVFYIAFTRKFLDTAANYPLLERIFVLEENLILIILGSFTFIVFFTDNFQLQKAIENGMKLIVLLIGVVYIAIALAQRNKLMNYLAIGNGMLIFFSAISFYIILFQRRTNSIFTNAMVYYEVGIVCELIFFLLGLAYKNRVELIGKVQEQESLKRAAEKLSYEGRLAVLNAQQKERNRISADMHDDLGAGVTAIRLYSELAKKRIGKETIPEIEKISSSANELLNNMNAIIWTMSSSNDSLDNMVAYIRSYALEYFENTGINCQIFLEENIPNIAVSGEIRRNVFMVVKEALNNILKHSAATNVSITLKKEERGLSLYIQDNGVGIDFDKIRRFGNGLINMKKRMEESGISFSIENNHGTLIRLYRELEPSP